MKFWEYFLVAIAFAWLCTMLTIGILVVAFLFRLVFL